MSDTREYYDEFTLNYLQTGNKNLIESFINKNGGSSFMEYNTFRITGTILELISTLTYMETLDSTFYLGDVNCESIGEVKDVINILVRRNRNMQINELC